MPRKKPSNRDRKPPQSMSSSHGSIHSPAMEFALRLGSHSDARRVPNAVLGTIVFVVAEIMFFAALISAHTIARASAMEGMWPPPGQPRLPVERTAINTAALLLSGVLLWMANRFMRSAPKIGAALSGRLDCAGDRFRVAAGSGMGKAAAPGPYADLQRGGIVLLSDRRDARPACRGRDWFSGLGLFSACAAEACKPEIFTATQVFWYFVVALWPIIYLRVYL